MKTCSDCKSQSFVRLPDGLTCTNCGTINGPDVTSFQNEAEYESSKPNESQFSTKKVYISSDSNNKQTYIKDYQESKKKKLFDIIHSMVSVVSVSQSYLNRIKLITLKIMGDKIKVGEKARHIVASVIYAVCRENNIPLTLLDISKPFQMDVYRLGKYYMKFINAKKVKSQGANNIDPGLFIERVISDLLKNVEIVEDEKINLRNEVLRLVHFANDRWLGTGRHPNTIIGACLYIIFLSIDTYKSFADINIIASSLSITASTIRTRFNEIISVLLKSAEDLPWGKNVNKKNVLLHVDEILKYSDFLKRDLNVLKNERNTPKKKKCDALPTVINSNKKQKINEKEDDAITKIETIISVHHDDSKEKKTSYPPSYENALKKKVDLESRIRSAKHRLSNICKSLKDKLNLEKFESFDRNDCCGEEICKNMAKDDVDLKIQKLLLEDVPENLLSEGYHSYLFDASKTKLLPLELMIFDEDEIHSMIRSDDEIKNLNSILPESS